jgi:N-acetylglucosamine-6-sulfatase
MAAARMRTKRKGALAAAVALVLLLALGAGASEPASGASPRPNVVLISTDDQTAASMSVMKRVQSLLVDQGTTFSNQIISFPLCCPSRATWITGQYAHNHGVLNNLERGGGGYQMLVDKGKVLPVWLQANGYDTTLVGKFLHDYRTLDPAPGWDDFWALTSPTMTRYYGYEVTNGLGGKVTYPPDDEGYVTTTLTDRYAVPYIQAHAADPDPFFLHVSYTAPHWGKGRDDTAGRRCASGKPFDYETARAKPAPGDAGRFRHLKLPEPPSFNEKDMTDKPNGLRKFPPLKKSEIKDMRGRYQCELASLLAVDRSVKRIDDALAATGVRDNTYVIFTSDNGYMHGEHRIPAEKVQPYEEAIRTPLVIRGPGVAAGVTVSDPVSNVDLAPTIMDMAQASQPPLQTRPIDGRSLLPYTSGGRDPGRAVLIEAKKPPRSTATGLVADSWIGVRTERYVYVEYYRLPIATLEEGDKSPIGAGSPTDAELYDLALDPYELESRDSDPAYATVRATLAGTLVTLRSCVDAACLTDVAVPSPAVRR